MKAYKGFNKDMTCLGFQYEEGREYHEDEAELCKKGFHACLNPLDCLKYYSPINSIYREVEIDGVSDERTNDDTKICAKRIKIGAEIGIKGVIDAGIKFIFKRCKNTASGDSGNAAASGVSGNAAASGYRGNAAASGDYGNAAASGYRGNAAASCVSGNAAASGWNGTAVVTGYAGSASADGPDCIAIAWGEDCKAKGKIGTWIVLSEHYKRKNGVKNARLAYVDGTKVKADTWYKLENDNLIEVED